jgi:hypothetical protein
MVNVLNHHVTLDYNPFNEMWNVTVSVLKENTLRGDSYWVVKMFRSYRNKVHAELYADRFGSAPLAN